MPPSQLDEHSPGARKDEKATLPLPARRGGGGWGQCRGRCVASEAATRNIGLVCDAHGDQLHWLRVKCPQ